MAKSIVAAVTNIIFGYLVDWNIKYTLMGVGLTVMIFAVLSGVEEEHLKD